MCLPYGLVSHIAMGYAENHHCLFCSLTFPCSYHGTSSQRKDGMQMAYENNSQDPYLCKYRDGFSLSPRQRGKSPVPKSPREVRAAELARPDGWQHHGHTLARASGTCHCHPPAPGLATSCHQKAQGTGTAMPRGRPAHSPAPCCPQHVSTP